MPNQLGLLNVVEHDLGARLLNVRTAANAVELEIVLNMNPLLNHVLRLIPSDLNSQTPKTHLNQYWLGF